MGRSGATNCPAPFVAVRVVRFISAFVTFTVTLGMAAPEGSVTVPRIVAVDAWPRAGGAVTAKKVKKQIHQLTYIAIRCILEIGLILFTANSFWGSRAGWF